MEKRAPGADEEVVEGDCNDENRAARLWKPRNVDDGEDDEESDDMSTALMIEQTKQPQHGSTDKIKSQQ